MQLKAARVYEEHHRALGERSLGKRYVRKLEAEVDGLKQQYGDDFRHEYGWAVHVFNQRQTDFSQIEKAVKLDFMRPFFRAASAQVHASSHGAVLRSGLPAEDAAGLSLLSCPSNYGFADPGINSIRSLLLATVSLAQVEPTLDTNIMSMILANWSGPAVESFAIAQLALEERDERIRARD
jgi:hypothetical protein